MDSITRWQGEKTATSTPSPADSAPVTGRPPLPQASSSANVTESKAPSGGQNKSRSLTQLSSQLFDSIAGVIVTRFFNASGEVQTQSPPQSVVAYLRMGLTATGQPEASKDAPSKDTTSKLV